MRPQWPASSPPDRQLIDDLMSQVTHTCGRIMQISFDWPLLPRQVEFRIFLENAIRLIRISGPDIGICGTLKMSWNVRMSLNGGSRMCSAKGVSLHFPSIGRDRRMKLDVGCNRLMFQGRNRSSTKSMALFSNKSPGCVTRTCGRHFDFGGSPVDRTAPSDWFPICRPTTSWWRPLAFLRFSSFRLQVSSGQGFGRGRQRRRQLQFESKCHFPMEMIRRIRRALACRSFTAAAIFGRKKEPRAVGRCSLAQPTHWSPLNSFAYF